MASRRKRRDRSGCAVTVTTPAGAVVGQSAGSRELAGVKFNQACWELHHAIKGVEGLPCRAGCSRALIRDGEEMTHRITIRGRPHQLWCAPVNGKVISVLVRAELPGQVSDPGKRLTPREVDVLRLLADGLPAPGIATKLSISTSTVRAHLENMRAKLEVKTQAALVARGFRLNYLE